MAKRSRPKELLGLEDVPPTGSKAYREHTVSNSIVKGL